MSIEVEATCQSEDRTLVVFFFIVFCVSCFFGFYISIAVAFSSAEVCLKADKRTSVLCFLELAGSSHLQHVVCFSACCFDIFQ